MARVEGVDPRQTSFLMHQVFRRAPRPARPLRMAGSQDPARIGEFENSALLASKSTPNQNRAGSSVLAARNLPDVILLDIQLPALDGYAVATELRKNSALRNTPIVAVTSYAMVGDREKALASGATDYIEKPIDPDTFADNLRKHFPRY